jgi:hypothetical protein
MESDTSTSGDKMSTELEKFILSKIADVEVSIRSREQAHNVWANGTDEVWAAAAAIHGGGFIPQRDRLEIAAREGRILAKKRAELDMFRRVLAALQPSQGGGGE